MVIRLLPYWTLLLIVCCCFFPFLRKYLCNLHSFLSVMYSNFDEVILSLNGEMMMFFFLLWHVLICIMKELDTGIRTQIWAGSGFSSVLSCVVHICDPGFGQWAA